MPRLDDGTGWKAGDTAQAGAVRARTNAGTIRLRVLDLLQRCPDPLTAEEIALRLKLEDISVKPRISELRAAGKVKDSGVRRMGRYGVRVAAWTVTHRSPTANEVDHA